MLKKGLLLSNPFFICKMTNQKKIKIIFVIFTVVMIGFGIFFMSKTTPPWKRSENTPTNTNND